MKLENKVVLHACDGYDETRLTEILRTQMDMLGYDSAFFAGKKVVIKPNLVMKKEPDAAATTHPVVLSALLTVLAERDCKPLIAESPGGLFNRQRLEGVYRVCGITPVAEKHGVPLNYDTDSVNIAYPDGKTVKMFHILKPVAEADILIDLCKLKSHSLTKMSAAVKNFFGTIPGIEKFEMHATFPDYKDFGSMICDLCEMYCKTKKVIAITDAVVGMEGNGPTAGDPRKIGAMLMSSNPFASDVVGETLLGFAGTVPIVREGVARGLAPSDISGITLLGDDIKPLLISDFKEPDTAENRAPSALTVLSRGKLGRFFMPRPVAMSDKCRGCGECVASCPQHTIELVVKNGKKLARVRHGNCIRCYCCQELCPFEAIKVKKNFVIRIVGSI
ncbi:MAG: DUF362 domain-containing protein [Clostridia bacterium]|nr:DUF362 domain-containing protein [Clostridia bacterium]